MIIGQCPIGVMVEDEVEGFLVDLLFCQELCAQCLPPNVCNVFGFDPSAFFPTKCVPPLSTQVNDRLLLEHIQVIW